MPLPNDLGTRMNEILHLIVVLPSAQAGLPGRLDKLVVAGDSSVLPTAASMHGAKTYEKTRFERCDCGRKYADPDAAVGYDANAKTTLYEHRFTATSCGTQRHDLPLAIDLQPANVPDAEQRDEEVTG